MPQCTAHRRNGDPCKAYAVHGYPVCTKHGAGTKARPGGRPVEHGRYSKLHHARIKGLMETFLTDPTPLALYDELALLRALVQDFIDRYEAWREALLAWHATRSLRQDESAAPRPREVLDITDVYRILAEIGRMVERIDAIERGPVLTQRDMATVLRRMSGVVEAVIGEQSDLLQQIEEGWRGITDLN